MRTTIGYLAAALVVGAEAFAPSSFMGLRSASSDVRSMRRASLTSPQMAVKFEGDRKMRVAVIGGGPSGACAAEALAKEKNIDTYLFERKMDNAKPCGGAIPLCMIGEFDIPDEVVDRRVTKMNMVSPTGKEVAIGQTLAPNEYIGMCRREILDAFLRNRAFDLGAKSINGLVTKIDVPAKGDMKTPYKLYYSNYNGEKVGVPEELEVDVVIGADGANSRVAKAIDAGEYNYAIAFQERMTIPDDKMKFYMDLAEMYVGDDVSPDFYGWVFPKYDHVAVGTGTVINRPAIKQYQNAIRARAGDKIKDGKIIKIEAHPIPEHLRPKRVQNRAMLVGDAAGYVTKCSGEGIYFAAKSGRMAGEAVVELSQRGTMVPSQADIEDTYIRKYDQAYGATYAVLDILQQVFYRSNPAREAFVEMCESEYVQKVTFDSYLYKTVQGNDPVSDIKLLWNTVNSLIKQNRRTDLPKDAKFSNPVESLQRL